MITPARDEILANMQVSIKRYDQLVRARPPQAIFSFSSQFVNSAGRDLRSLPSMSCCALSRNWKSLNIGFGGKLDSRTMKSAGHLSFWRVAD